MINRDWFIEFSGFETLEEDLEGDSQSLILKSGKRILELFVNKLDNQGIITDIFLKENNIHLCSFSTKNVPIEEIKLIFRKWLVEILSIEDLKKEFDKIDILDIYEYYLKGENGLLEYRWLDIEKSLFENHSKNRGVEFLKLCKKSEILNQFVPYVSLGRFCLGTKNEISTHNYDFLCFYFYEEKYIVSNYENTKKYIFDNVKDSIEFAENQVDSIVKST